MPAPAPPLILFHTAFFGAPPDVSDLPEADRLAFTWDRALLPDADAVVFHIPDLHFGKPGLGEVLRLAKRPGQLWVAWSMESEVNYPLLGLEAFMRRFDVRMTFQRAADIWTPYLPDRATWRSALRRPVPAKEERAPVVLFLSSPIDRSGRHALATALMRHIPVDSYGRLLHNRTMPAEDGGRLAKLATLARYRFCLCLENSLAPDYVTEKFYDPLLVGTVPVYLGASNIDRFAPGDHAFINVGDFPDPAALASHLLRLNGNESDYRRLLEWRERPLSPDFEADLDAIRVSPFRKLVDLVRRHRDRRIALAESGSRRYPADRADG